MLPEPTIPKRRAASPAPQPWVMTPLFCVPDEDEPAPVPAPETGADVRSVITSDTGSFNVTNLPAGRYTVTVKNSGFQSFVAKGVILNVAEKHTLDVQLQTGKASETVEVTAENTPIQTTTAEESGHRHRGAGARAGAEQPQLRTTGINSARSRQPIGDEPGFGLSSNTAISVNGSAYRCQQLDGGRSRHQRQRLQRNLAEHAKRRCHPGVYPGTQQLRCILWAQRRRPGSCCD